MKSFYSNTAALDKQHANASAHVARAMEGIANKPRVALALKG